MSDSTKRSGETGQVLTPWEQVVPWLNAEYGVDFPPNGLSAQAWINLEGGKIGFVTRDGVERVMELNPDEKMGDGIVLNRNVVEERFRAVRTLFEVRPLDIC